MSKRQWDNFGTTWDNIGQQPLETTMLNYKSERDKKTNTGNSALGEGTYISNIVTACIGGVVSRALCRARFVT